MAALFSVTLLLSAFLLFLVQPMFARLVLPRFGGSPSVWNTCMLFFQAALLLGYGYSHVTTRRLRPRAQALLHGALLLLPLLCLPIAVPAGWAPPAERHPVVALLSLMLLTVGPPFVMISTSAPLLQRWFSLSGHPRAGDPYFLYGASNLGSLLALLGYPLLLEPRLSLLGQGRLFTVGYGLLLTLVALCAAAALRRGGEASSGAAEPAGADEAAPSWARRARWVALAAGASSLMLGATTHITTDMAAVPLLWVAPLSAYLLSFVVAFARRPPIPHSFVARAFPYAVVVLLLALLRELSQPLLVVISLHVAFVLIVSLYCHGELAQDRPAPRHLTEFFLWLSVGGVLGGCFNALLSPVLFKEITEYPVAVVFVCLLQRHAAPLTRRSLLRSLAQAAALGGGYFLLRHRMLYGGWIEGVGWRRGLSALSVLVLLPQLRRPLYLGLGAAALLLAHDRWEEYDDVSLFRGRSFFGSYRVRQEDGERNLLLHGTTQHGVQKLAPESRAEPLSYYHRDSPIADVVTRGRAPLRSLAVIGLGTGTLAAYGGRGTDVTFFEIDPLVRWLAAGSGYFTYLSDAEARGATVRVVLGDARLSLAPVPDGRYDVIAVDAFSSDAIPVHLLTREALDLYMRKLSPGGVLSFHVTNRYLALGPIIGDLAAAAGLAGRSRDDWRGPRAGERKDRSGKKLDELAYKSHWVAVARRAEDLSHLTLELGWEPLLPSPPSRGARPWTDDYSNLVGAID